MKKLTEYVAIGVTAVAVATGMYYDINAPVKSKKCLTYQGYTGFGNLVFDDEKQEDRHGAPDLAASGSPKNFTRNKKYNVDYYARWFSGNVVKSATPCK